MTGALRAGSVAAILCVVSIASWTLLGQGGPAESVSRFTDDLLSRVEARLDLASELEPARDDVVRVLRNYSRAAHAWQLDPVLAREVSEADLFSYVSQRAQQTLVCGVEALRTYALEGLAEEPESSLARQFYRPSAEPVAGGLHISWDCATLLDEADRPVTLRNVEDFRTAMALNARFDVNAAAGLLERGFVNDATFRANMRYLDEEYGAAPKAVPDFSEQAGLTLGMTLFEQRLINLTVYVGYEEGESKLIFVAPLSH